MVKIVKLCKLHQRFFHLIIDGSLIKEQLNQLNISINEGTLYPLLNRMHDNGYLSSIWKTPENNKGHPIRQYNINEQGKNLFQILLAAYQENYNALQALIKKN